MIEIKHMNFGWLHAPPLPPACCHGIMIRKDQRIMLVDTGIGMKDIADPEARIGRGAIEGAGFRFFREATAVRQLERFGIEPSAVMDIVLTHGDPDHAGGLADFPDATVHVSAEELANLESGNQRYSTAQFSHRPHWKSYSDNDETFFSLPARRIEGSLNAEILLVPLFGHTLGHCGVAVRGGDKWILHVGDAYYLKAELNQDDHPVSSLAQARADDDTARRKTLDSLRELRSRHAEEVAMNGYHDVTELNDSIPGMEAFER